LQVDDFDMLMHTKNFLPSEVNNKIEVSSLR